MSADVSTRDLAVPVRSRSFVVPGIAAATVLARLLEIRSDGSPDESGFLVLANQWHAGTSLYGNYWVDRPPLLITLFRVADLFGGLMALRVVGALFAAAAVLLLASTSRRVFGRRAAVWTAVVAGALLVTPLYGATGVNGELLAVPFLALGLRCAVEAVFVEDPLRSRGAALGAGVAAMAALLVKQNMADVIVFAAVCWFVAWRSERISWRRFVELAGSAALGAIGTYAVVMLWAMAHGTSPLGVYQATYPFRVRAAHVIADQTASTAGIRLSHLGQAFLFSGVPLLVIAIVVLGVRRSRAPGVIWGVLAVLAWCALSVLSGGSYWLHYLIESVPALALGAGAVSLASPRILRGVAAVLVLSSVVAAATALVHPTATPGTVVGKAIAGAADKGDTMISAFGDADILRNSGMSSPYPYLWSLPSRTLDPDMTLLRGVLAGPSAPTWIVVRGSGTATRLSDGGAMQLIKSRYHVEDSICGRVIYLLRGVVRPPVVASGRCHALVLP